MKWCGRGRLGAVRCLRLANGSHPPEADSPSRKTQCDVCGWLTARTSATADRPPGGRGAGSKAPRSHLMFDLRQRFLVARALGEHGLPQALCLTVVAALGGKGGQVAPRQMSKNSLVHAAKLVGPFERQESPPAGFGCRGFAAVTVHDGLAEPELGILGLELEAARTRAQGRLRIAPHLVHAGNLRKQLADDRIGRRRQRQASLEVPQGRGPILPLNLDRAQVEQDKRIIGPLLELGAEDARRRDRASGRAAPGRRSRCAAPRCPSTRRES